MEAQAAVLRSGDGPFSIETVQVADPGEGEALVRMVAAGMCHTDLLSRELPPEFFGGPTVYGHEGAGVVEAVGPGVDYVAPGDHVVLSFNSCQGCKACSLERPASCFDFMALNMGGSGPSGSPAFTDAEGQPVASHFFGQSSFASHTIVAKESLVKVDPALDLTKLGPLGCGIQTGAGTVFNSLDVVEGDSFAVAGAGALGMASIMAAKVAGASTIVAIDRHQNRLDLAKKYGATHTITGDPSTFAAQVIEATRGGADHAFDTTGNAIVVRALLEGLNNVGVLALAGVGFGELTIDYSSMLSGRKIIGIMEGDAVPSTFIPYLAKLNAEGKFPFDELIKTYPIDQINEAEAASASGEVIKPVLVF